MNKQILEWEGQFGKEYTDRNASTLEDMEELYKSYYGVSRTQMNHDFIGNLDHNLKILEVGCNIGTQLQRLQKDGFSDLYGIEINDYAIDIARSKAYGLNIIKGSALDIPFKDDFFDLVFTSGVLIHISPDNISAVIHEIYRCSRKNIWGFEYYAPEYTAITYRGHRDLLWKTDFARLYTDHFPDLKLLKEIRYKYQENDNIDAMFLLQKVKGQ